MAKTAAKRPKGSSSAARREKRPAAPIAKRTRPQSGGRRRAQVQTARSGARKASPPLLTHPSARARFAAVTAERERLEKTVEVERAERMAVYEAELARLGRARAATAAPVLRILAEGDSWFDYPVGTDVIRSLEKLIKLPIANMAHHGDEVRQMLSLKQRKEIEKRFATGAPDGHPWDSLLFSGGGNDFVGDELCIWIKPYSSGMTAAQVLNAIRFGAIMQIVEAGYRDLIDIRDRLSPNTKLFCHQYDFAPPNGKGVCNVGPWLKPSLDFRLVPPNLQIDVVKLMLQQFATLIASLAASARNVFVVPTQGTFPAETDEWWANELHPTNKGFKAIAEKFRNVLKSQSPDLP